MGDASRVDDHIRRARGPGNGFDRLRGLARVRHVYGGDAEPLGRVAPRGFHILQRRIQHFFPPRCQPDMCPLRGQLFGGCQPDSAGTAGDKGNFIFPVSCCPHCSS